MLAATGGVVGVVGGAVGLWLLANMGGWALGRSFQREPWNWRILAGPNVYLDWLESEGLLHDSSTQAGE